MNTVTTLIWAALILFVVLIVVGLIVDRKKTWKILQWIMIGLGVVLLGWVAAKFKVNIGKYVNNLTGMRKKMPTSVVNTSGESIGNVVGIVNRKNPVRDHGVIETTDGQKIQLPKGVSDFDVEKVTVINDTDYNVEIRHEKLTDLFATDNS